MIGIKCFIVILNILEEERIALNKNTKIGIKVRLIQTAAINELSGIHASTCVSYSGYISHVLFHLLQSSEIVMALPSFHTSDADDVD